MKNITELANYINDNNFKDYKLVFQIFPGLTGTNLVEFIGDDIRKMRRFFQAAEGNVDLMDRYLCDLFNPSK